MHRNLRLSWLTRTLRSFSTARAVVRLVARLSYSTELTMISFATVPLVAVLSNRVGRGAADGWGDRRGIPGDRGPEPLEVGWRDRILDQGGGRVGVRENGAFWL